jgi:hypothetical protein
MRIFEKSSEYLDVSAHPENRSFVSFHINGRMSFLRYPRWASGLRELSPNPFDDLRRTEALR